MARIKSGLHCSDEEARDIMEYDKKVERGEKTEYDLTDEQKKIAAKYTRTGTRKAPTVYNFTQRKRKPNATKAGIIAELIEFLSTNSQFSIEDLKAIKPERMIAFRVGENKFELTLTQKRNSASANNMKLQLEPSQNDPRL